MEEKKERDNELVVLGRMMRALNEQDPDARHRIIHYLLSWAAGSDINRTEVLSAKPHPDLARVQVN